MDASNNAAKQKSSAIIDHSLFQPICAEPESVQVQLWQDILSRYDLVIPFVLVEEVWKDLACPGKKGKDVLHGMARAMYGMSSRWIDDPIEIAFKELVLKETIQTLPNPPQKLREFLFKLDDEDPQLIAFLNNRRVAKEKRIKEVIAEQDSMLPPGTFCFVESKNKFFQVYIRSKFVEILEDPTRTNNLLEKVFGRNFRERYPDHAEKLNSVFSDYNKTTFIQYPMTLHCIMASMFYFYAPIFRIGEKTQSDARKIIGRSFHDQINNVEDEKYVISAMMCQRLLTCDKGMASIMNAFRECGLWEGQVIYLKRSDLPSQIPSKLI